MNGEWAFPEKKKKKKERRVEDMEFQEVLKE